MQEALSSDPDSSKQKLSEFSRKITVLRVNERSLTRKLTILQTSENALKKVYYCEPHIRTITLVILKLVDHLCKLVLFDTFQIEIYKPL